MDCLISFLPAYLYGILALARQFRSGSGFEENALSPGWRAKIRFLFGADPVFRGLRHIKGTSLAILVRG
jgi:hypothetical protein